MSSCFCLHKWLEKKLPLKLLLKDIFSSALVTITKLQSWLTCRHLENLYALHYISGASLHCHNKPPCAAGAQQ